jgi:tyrosyl-tRNA synthetase
MNYIQQLTGRGMVHQSFPGTEAFLDTGMKTGYAGFDPTAASLHIGNMVPIMMLVHLQRSGHRPIALVGGATGMVGDPSGKSQERNLLSADELKFNQECIHKQLSHFLDFGDVPNRALMLNNHDWFGNMGFLEFLRDIGKHLTINYMIAKDSVQNRMETGISFTEFSYQLLQGYDFYYLWKHHDCTMQVGGSDQWGNITTGTELIRRMGGGDAYAVTCPLITKADGTKFGKSEGGNIWLDGKMTSPFQFYQFWYNQADADLARMVRIFSLRELDEIEQLLASHAQDPGRRMLQTSLAEELTLRLHGAEALRKSQVASRILYSKNAVDDLRSLTPEDAKEIFSGVKEGEIQASQLEAGVNILEFLQSVGAAPSRSEAKRMVSVNKSVSVNMVKETEGDRMITIADAISGKFILVQTGKQDRVIVFIK